MTDIALAVLAEFKRIQVVEDGDIYMDFEKHIACTVVGGNQKPLRFNFAEYESSIYSILEALLAEDCIKKQMRDYTYIRVTHKGWHYHSRLEQMRQQQAQQERQQRFENKVSVLSLLIPLVTFLGGLLLEYYVGIISFIGGLFH